MKKLLLIPVLLGAILLLCACGAQTDSGDPDYEAQTIAINGLKDLDGAFEVSVADLRALPQVELDASYLRTTGLYEEFHMVGPRLSDVIELAGGDLTDYAAAAAVGRDGYYCLYDREVIEDRKSVV